MMDASGNQISESIIKTLFSLVPFAGQALNETFYDFRGRVKQQRLNDFSELLAAYFKQHEPLNYQDLNAIEFSDLFESVIMRVAHTGSREKQCRFRDILISYLENPRQSLDHKDTFLELVAVLNESCIQILKYYALCDLALNKTEADSKHVRGQISEAIDMLDKEKKLQDKGFANNTHRYVVELGNLQTELQTIEAEQQQLSGYTCAEFYGLSPDDFLYLKQILVSRALLTDHGIGTLGHEPFYDMRITIFGQQFIAYIKEGGQ